MNRASKYFKNQQLESCEILIETNQLQCFHQLNGMCILQTTLRDTNNVPRIRILS